MDQRNVLTVLGCSGSLALVAMFASPASANMLTQQNADQLQVEAPVMAASQGQGNSLLDTLGCSCATCQSSQRQTLI
jgi:hypothetical protein